MGRPTKLTPETQERIAQAISLGATYEMAAWYGHVSYNSFRNWMKAGEEEAARVEQGRKPRKSKARFLEFFNAIKEAEAQALVRWLSQIEKSAMTGTWQAAAWKIERRYPSDYGRTVQDVHQTSETVVKIIDGVSMDEI